MPRLCPRSANACSANPKSMVTDTAKFRVVQRTVAVAVLACWPLSAFAQETVDAARVTNAVAHLRADIDGMRFVMGASVVAPARWEVSQAAPRHALYTAQTLFAKVSRLAHEVAGEPLLEPPASSAVTPAAVLAMVASTHERLRILLAHVGVEPARSASESTYATWADALVGMVDANQQLNALLVHEYRLAEIYDLVVESIAHVAGIANAPVPRLPRLVVGKTPTDVYQRLLDCYQLTRQTEALRDMRTLRLNLRRERRRADVPPSEAYDLMRLLLADIAGIAQGLQAPPKAVPFSRPDYIYSAHVYRLADVLAKMLETLGQ